MLTKRASPPSTLEHADRPGGRLLRHVAVDRRVVAHAGPEQVDADEQRAPAPRTTAGPSRPPRRSAIRATPAPAIVAQMAIDDIRMTASCDGLATQRRRVGEQPGHAQGVAQRAEREAAGGQRERERAPPSSATAAASTSRRPRVRRAPEAAQVVEPPAGEQRHAEHGEHDEPGVVPRAEERDAGHDLQERRHAEHHGHPQRPERRDRQRAPRAGAGSARRRRA